jgi:cytochrome c peroxidase
MPQMLRIAMSDALSFNPGVETSGPRAHFNFSKFRKLKANTGLSKTFKVIKELKTEGNHITEKLSISDLIQLGGASAVEYCGGPFIDIKVGRVDIEDDHYAADSTNLPHPDMDVVEIRSKYQALGFDDNLIVALFGYRTLGFLCNKDSNKEERWTRNPWVFDNNYFEEILDRNSPYVKTPSDLALIKDDQFRQWVESYAKNEKLFFDHFALAYQKMSELGTKNLLEENTSYLNY